MTNSDYEKLEAALRHVMELLAAKEYDALIIGYPGSTVSADELRRAVNEYGRTIVVPPFDDDYRKKSIYLYEKTNVQIPTWEVEAQVWTAEEGYSDLTLSFTVILVSGGLELFLRNLHVL